MNKTDTKKSTKVRVGIFFGGKSAEHEISVQSAKNVVAAIDTDKFTPVLIGIDKAGKWHVVDNDHLIGATEVASLLTDSYTLIPGGANELLNPASSQKGITIDVAFPILHGPLGEDGTIQGLFEIANIPYVGPGVLGSAVGMDKDVMKRLLRDAGIAVTPFNVFHLHEKESIKTEAILAELGSSVFVKPANMGSSVGVNQASSPEELQNAINTAFKYDSKILVESAIVGDEIECAVLGNLSPEASVIGRIVPRAGDFYSYEAKYIDDNGAVLEIPADIPTEQSERARATALKTFQTLGCEGMGRVDMFLTRDGQIIVNEINTIPGFTKISMYPKLWEATGLSYTDLITKLLELAIERHTRRSALKTSFS